MAHPTKNVNPARSPPDYVSVEPLNASYGHPLSKFAIFVVPVVRREKLLLENLGRTSRQLFSCAWVLDERRPPLSAVLPTLV